MIHPIVPKQIGVFAAQQLSNVDYSVATRVSEDVATVIQWSFEHDTWWLSPIAIQSLKYFDEIGSFLINIVVWIIMHT